MRHPIRSLLAIVCVAASVFALAATASVRPDTNTRHAAGHVVRHPHGRSRIPRHSHLNTAFDRFRLHDVDAGRLRPNFSDFAARTTTHSPLLLFLPATRARPSDYRRFLFTALSLGYHVLGLDYWNLGTTLTGTCAADARCYTLVQRNRFDGRAGLPFSTVRPSGSITSRFRDAVSHLRSSDPHGGWGRYVSKTGAIQWRDIVVAGHSQGGGEAAYIAHVRRVRGALMFSSPVESLGSVHATWMNQKGLTPVADEYAMDDAGDVFGSRIRGSWKAMGLDGSTGPWRTDVATPPHGEIPHAILTTLDLGTPGQAHTRSVGDSTPLTDSGQPRYRPLWRWMLRRLIPASDRARMPRRIHATHGPVPAGS